MTSSLGRLLSSQANRVYSRLRPHRQRRPEQPSLHRDKYRWVRSPRQCGSRARSSAEQDPKLMRRRTRTCTRARWAAAARSSYLFLQPKMRGRKWGQGAVPRRYGPPQVMDEGSGGNPCKNSFSASPSSPGIIMSVPNDPRIHPSSSAKSCQLQESLVHHNLECLCHHVSNSQGDPENASEAQLSN